MKELTLAKRNHDKRRAGTGRMSESRSPLAQTVPIDYNRAAVVAAASVVARERALARSATKARAGLTALGPEGDYRQNPRKKLDLKFYLSEIANLNVELVKLQEWIKARGLKVVVLFEGRDAAGKGGAIKTISAPLNPRVCRVVALGTPTDREKTQRYFGRYVAQLPAAGEMVLFDRSWYNRAGVEHVMGFCSQEEYAEYLRSCPEFERMLLRSGIILIKYWFSVGDAEQEKRFQDRLADPTKHWKLSPMDVMSRSKWVEYSRAKDAMFSATDIPEAPWWVVAADDKKLAHLNTIRHLLSVIPYEDIVEPKIELPPRQVEDGYVRPPIFSQHFVPDEY
jgi:polyphosphate kinase 2